MNGYVTTQLYMRECVCRDAPNQLCQSCTRQAPIQLGLCKPWSSTSSVLGPLLVICYLNDTADVLHSTVRKSICIFVLLLVLLLLLIHWFEFIHSWLVIHIITIKLQLSNKSQLISQYGRDRGHMHNNIMYVPESGELYLTYLHQKGEE